MNRYRLPMGILVGTAIVLSACGENLNAPAGDTALLSVVPAGGSTDVDPNASVIIEFDRAMHTDMYVALHDGAGVTGPLVDGGWAWTGDLTRLTFTHAMPLNSMADYTIHLGGGMMDSDGNVINLEQHGHDMGGDWVTQQMMDQRTMHGGTMMGGDDMLGFGWMHDNGSFGMVFSFTTR